MRGGLRETADWSLPAQRSCTTLARLPEAAAVSHVLTPPSPSLLGVLGEPPPLPAPALGPPRRAQAEALPLPLGLFRPGSAPGGAACATLSRFPRPVRAQVSGDASARKTAAD